MFRAMLHSRTDRMRCRTVRAVHAPPPVLCMPPVVPAAALLFEQALGGFSGLRHSLDAALVGDGDRRPIGRPSVSMLGRLSAMGWDKPNRSLGGKVHVSVSVPVPLELHRGCGRCHLEGLGASVVLRVMSEPVLPASAGVGSRSPPAGRSTVARTRRSSAASVGGRPRESAAR